MNIGGRILWSHLKTPGVTVSVQRAPKPQVYLYKVVNMVDMGRAGRTAIMHPFDTNDGFEAIPMDKESHKKTRLSVPHRVGNLQFLYASKERARIMDMNYVMNCALNGAGRKGVGGIEGCESRGAYCGHGNSILEPGACRKGFKTPLSAR